MLKRGLTFALALVMLASVSVANGIRRFLHGPRTALKRLLTWVWPTGPAAGTPKRRSLAATLRRTPLLWWRWRMALTWQRMKDSVCYS